MSFNFPNNPNLNDQLQIDDNIYVWNGVSWDLIRSSGGLGSISEDLNPSLGGILDLNTNDISGTGNVDIVGNISASGNVSGSFVGDLSGNVEGDVTGDISSSGASFFSGSVDFDGSNISNFPNSVIQNALGSLSLDDFSEVDISTNPPVSDQFLVWDEAVGKFVPLSIEDLLDSIILKPNEKTDGSLGSDLNIYGGESNGDGGNVNILGGNGDLNDGKINIGTAQTESVNIGSEGVDISINGDALFNTGTQERFSTIDPTVGTVVDDCSSGHIFYHKNLISDFTVNFINLGLKDNYATTLTLIIEQGNSSFIPAFLEIEGVSQNIKWQAGFVPQGTDNGVDVVSFSVLKTESSYLILGQLVDFQ